MLSLTALVLAANVLTPPATQVRLSPDGKVARFETGTLSAPLTGQALPGAVTAWALTQRARYGLSATATLKPAHTWGTRFGASVRLLQLVNDVEVYQARLVVTVDAQRRVKQVSSNLTPFTRVVDGAPLTADEALTLAAREVPGALLRPDGVPQGGARPYYFLVGTELHSGFLTHVPTLDLRRNWYVGLDTTTGQTLFVQDRVYRQSLDTQVYPISPGGLDAGVGVTPLVNRQLVHGDGGSMLGDICDVSLPDGGFGTVANDGGHLCGTQLMMYNCCPTADCDAGAPGKRVQGQLSLGAGLNINYDVVTCDRQRRASNLTNPTGDFVYAPVDPPTNRAAVEATDPANSDEFAEVHAFYHVNQVYDWVRALSVSPAGVGGTPFAMRHERPAVWVNAMFPNFEEVQSQIPGCLFAGPCRADTLMRIDNAAFMPREQFSQLPISGFDTGADTLLIFQGNNADAAYDATVIQHEFGHGVVHATAELGLDQVAVDAHSANNESGALHEAFADYIAAAFNNEPAVGPYFGPRATAGQSLPGVSTDSYLRNLGNQNRCPQVLWGEVHQDAMHVAEALWQARTTVFAGSDQGATFDAAFYAMLVSIDPDANFADMAAAMSARAADAFPGIPDAAAQLTAIFEARGVVGCTKSIDVGSDALPRTYFGIPSLGSSLVPGPLQFRIPGAAGVASVRVTGSLQGGGGAIPGTPGQAPDVRVLTRQGGPVSFTRSGSALSNDAEQTVTWNAATPVPVNSPCGTDVYVAIAATGGGATFTELNVTFEPLTGCQVLLPDGGTPTDGGAPLDGGTTETLPAVGPEGVVDHEAIDRGCGCSSLVTLSWPLLGLLVLRRRKHRA